MSARQRLIALVAVCLLAVGGSIAYVVASRASQQASIRTAPKPKVATLAEVQAGPRVVFRSTALGADYGKVAMVRLSDPAGPRAITTLSCDRVYAAVQQTLCLSSDKGLVTTYKAELYGPNLGAARVLPLTGIPSRARLSADATLAATTSFTSGDSYAGTGFSTRTVVSWLSGQRKAEDLEEFTLIHQGKTIRPVDRNFWGVTFAADGDQFYATVAWASKTWLVKGSLAKRQVTTVRPDAECPSLSPDGTRVAYKKRAGQPPGTWRLATLDLATGTERLLGETRSVDDQVAWLDDDHVIYGLPRAGSQAAVTDVFAVPADGSGRPVLLIPQAWSPAVVR